MFKMVKRNEKGFTLIELMIVIAIIGILAAIAIPQFAAYRVRGFDSSAQSDVKNVATSEASFFSDWQVFANTLAAGTHGAGVVLTGPGTATTLLSSLDNLATPVLRTVQIGLGNGVSVVAHTDAQAVSYTAATKHLQGATYYGSDSDASAVYFTPGVVGTVLVATDAKASVSGADDFNGIAATTGGGTWRAK